MTVAGALLSAVVAGLIADGLVTVADDQRLRGSAQGLRTELSDVQNDTDATRIAEEESGEIAPAGLRLTLFKNERPIGGTRELAAPPMRGCSSSRDTHGEPIRVCADAAGPYLVAYWTSSAARASARQSYVAGVFAAIVVSALTALAFSRSLAAWAVQPLSRLRQAIANMSRESPRGIDERDLGGVAEVMSIAEALNDLVKKLAASLSESRRFAAGAAHELRTPLATVSAELELLAETSTPPLSETAHRIHRTVSGLSARVDNLLVLATVSANTRELLREAVSLAEIVEASIAALSPEQRSRVQLQSSDGAAMATVRGDATLLQMAVSNALDNALKFSGAAPIAVRLAVASVHVICEIHDGGPGVPLAERERVFEPFYRAAAIGANGVRGYGLGLALIAHVARAHGGTAQFIDTERGALLRLELPLWASPSEPT
jgi:signal transduction histidine kinase